MVTYVRDNHHGAVNPNSTTPTISLTNGYTTGDFVVLSLAYYAAANPLSSVTDANSNPYSILLDVTNANGVHTALILCYTVSSGGTPTITLHYSGNCTYQADSISEFSFGINPSAADKTASNTQAGTTALSTGTTAATTSPNELVIAVFGTYDSTNATGDTTTTPTSYTALPASGGITGVYCFPFYQIVSSTGAQSASSTYSAGAINAAGNIIATFADTGGALPKPLIISQAVKRAAYWHHREEHPHGRQHRPRAGEGFRLDRATGLALPQSYARGGSGLYRHGGAHRAAVRGALRPR